MRSPHAVARVPRPGTRTRSRALLAVVVLALAACGGRTRNPFDSSPGAGGSLFLYLQNQGFNDVRVYAVTGSGTRSLGPVGGNSYQRVTLPWRQLDQISFRIEVLAGRTYGTHAVAASPGDQVELIIPENPANYVVRIRN